MSGGPYIGPRGGKYADPAHKIPWREDAPKPMRHEHSVAAHHGLHSRIDTEMADAVREITEEDGGTFTDDDHAEYAEHHVTAPDESKVAAVRLVGDGGRYAIVHRSPKKDVAWQASYFDADGPSGDSPRKTLNEALKAARDRGYRVDDVVAAGETVEKSYRWVFRGVTVGLRKGHVQIPHHDERWPISVGPPQVKRAEYPFSGHIDFQGLDIDVENRAGSVRFSKDGEWSTTMFHHYGEVRGTEGSDGDPVDVYVCADQLTADGDSPLVVVVHQQFPDTGEYDEDKVMLGWRSRKEAVAAYKAQYDSPGFYGDATVMSIGRFRRLIEDQANGGQMVKAHLSELAKGAGHRYLARVPTGKTTKSGKPVYRYIYEYTKKRTKWGNKGPRVSLQSHLHDDETRKIPVGTAFSTRSGAHMHVEAYDQDTDVYTVRNDETGYVEKLKHYELTSRINDEHREAEIAVTAARKAKRTVVAKRMHGKMLAALEAFHGNPSRGRLNEVGRRVAILKRAAERAGWDDEDFVAAFGVDLSSPKTWNATVSEYRDLRQKVEGWSGSHGVRGSIDNPLSLTDPDRIRACLRLKMLHQALAGDWGSHGKRNITIPAKTRFDEGPAQVSLNDIIRLLGKKKPTHKNIMQAVHQATYDATRGMRRPKITVNPSNWYVGSDDDKESSIALAEAVMSWASERDHVVLLDAQFDHTAHLDADHPKRKLGYDVASAMGSTTMIPCRDASPEAYVEGYEPDFSPKGLSERVRGTYGEQAGDRVRELLEAGADPGVSMGAPGVYDSRKRTRAPLSWHLQVAKQNASRQAAKWRREHERRYAKAKKGGDRVAKKLDTANMLQPVIDRVCAKFGFAWGDDDRHDTGTSRGGSEATGYFDRSGAALNIRWAGRYAVRAAMSPEHFEVYSDRYGSESQAHPEHAEIVARGNAIADEFKAALRAEFLSEVKRRLGHKTNAGAAARRIKPSTEDERAQHEKSAGAPDGFTTAPYDMKADAGGLRELLGLMDPSVVPDASISLWSGAKKLPGAEAATRSHCGHDNQINLIGEKKHGLAWVIWHEYGHAIEHDSEGITEAANALRDERGKGQSVRTLDQAYKERWGDDSKSGHASYEKGYDDHWREAYGGDDYTGKWYGHGGSTEVLSMGVQYLQQDPLGFATRDPEHFHFTVAALSGQYGGRTGSSLKNARTARAKAAAEKAAKDKAKEGSS